MSHCIKHGELDTLFKSAACPACEREAREEQRRHEELIDALRDRQSTIGSGQAAGGSSGSKGGIGCLLVVGLAGLFVADLFMGNRSRTSTPSSSRPAMPPPASPAHAQSTASGCRTRMDFGSNFHLRSTDSPSRVNALALPGGAEVEVLSAGVSRRNGNARMYFVRVADGPGAGRTGYVFLHPSNLTTIPGCPQ